MNFFYKFLEALTITLALSIDSFVCTFAYGISKIKVPIKSVLTINFICCSVMAISVTLGVYIAKYIPQTITMWLGFSCLLLIGLIKLIVPILKKMAKKRLEKKHNFMLSIFSDSTNADINNNNILSPLEAVGLAFALSIDSLFVGFSAVVGHGLKFELVLAEFVTDFIAINLGAFIGNKMFKNIRLNLSWLSGVMLIGLAVFKLVFNYI